MGENFLMKPHESPRIRKKSIHGDSGHSWPLWNRGIIWTYGDLTVGVSKILTSGYNKSDWQEGF